MHKICKPVLFEHSTAIPVIIRTANKLYERDKLLKLYYYYYSHYKNISEMKGKKSHIVKVFSRY